MIINIALGVMLGVVFLIIAFIIAVAVGAAIVHMQDKMQEPRRIHTRIRPEAENYKHMQALKARAKANNPSHWKEERYED